MTNETKEVKVLRDPKIQKAILDLKGQIKIKALSQKEVRLSKHQKDPYERIRITVLHRLYLRLRGKDQEAHHLPPVSTNLYLFAQVYEEKLIKQYDLI